MIVKIQGIPINSNYIISIEKKAESPQVLILEILTVAKKYSFKYDSIESRNSAFDSIERMWRQSGRFYEIN